VARDAAGNSTTSASIIVTVNNTINPPPSTKFIIGDRIHNYGHSYVRSTAFCFGNFAGYPKHRCTRNSYRGQVLRSLMVLIGGIFNYDTGVDGWSVEDFLTKIVADTTLPVVSISSPTNSANVSGSITLSATASE